MTDTFAERLLGETDPERHYLIPAHDDPAADAELSYTVPGGSIWRPLALSVVLVAGIGGGNRIPRLRFTVFGEVVVEISAGLAVGAGATQRLSWCRGVGALLGEANAASPTAPMPDFLLPAGSTITTSTAGFFAGDDYGRPSLLVERVVERGPVAELRAAMVELAERLRDLNAAVPGGF
jgi:hypothetical protein